MRVGIKPVPVRTNGRTALKETVPKCANCAGVYSAAYRGCAVSKQASQIQNIVYENNVPYKNAKQQLKEKQRNSTPKAPQMLEPSNPQHEQEIPTKQVYSQKPCVKLLLKGKIKQKNKKGKNISAHTQNEGKTLKAPRRLDKKSTADVKLTIPWNHKLIQNSY